MQFFDNPPLPLGLWVIKRIDRFHFQHNDSESACVDVTLQRLPFDDVQQLRTLNEQQIAVLLGRPPKTINEQETQPFISRFLLAGSVASLHIGDVCEDTRRISRLPTLRREIQLNNETRIADVLYGSKVEPPPGWNASIFQALNKFEFSLDGVIEATRSRCLVFEFDGTEYILPKIVIFQTFYGFHTRMINALCNDAWTMSANEVISFADYASGITTGIDPLTGIWKIVLQTGLDETMANPIALLWFDPYARTQTSGLYTDSLKQNDGRIGAHGRSWLTGANIPYQLGQASFKLIVEGFKLRPFRPTTPTEFHQRFLITAILASSWPLRDQTIEYALHNSNEIGEEQQPSEEDRPYMSGNAPVEGDEDAINSSNADPSKAYVTNEFVVQPFEYLDAPPVLRQRKKSSQSYSSSPPPYSEGPSSVVSAGNASYAEGMPAPAVVITPIRAPSQQFAFLINALETLKKEGNINNFFPVMPEHDSDYAVDRNGLRCWSLLRKSDRKRKTIPKTGWEIIKDGFGTEGTRNKVHRSRRHARAVLIVCIEIGAENLFLFEIEPRSHASASAFCMVAFKPDGVPASWQVGSVLDNIRNNQGVFKNDELDHTFGPLTSNRVSSRRHAYCFTEHPDQKIKVATGLRQDLLLDWLLALAAFTDGSKEI